MSGRPRPGEEERPALQVLFCTGQSDPRTCALSPEQAAFLAGLDLPADVATVDRNFPYDAVTPAYRPVPLWLASLRHAVLAVRIRTPGWRRRHRAAVAERLRATDRTLVLAGSIGLDLLGRLDLPPDVLDRVVVVAYGAVATRPPACPTIRVGSRHDHLARWWRSDVEVAAGHLDYLAAPELTALVRRVVADLRAGRPVGAAPPGGAP